MKASRRLLSRITLNLHSGHGEHVGHPLVAAENKNGIIPTYSHVHPHFIGNVGYIPLTSVVTGLAAIKFAEIWPAANFMINNSREHL